MATYTLSYTGAEVNSAIGNAKNLFSATNTWTGTQTFGTSAIATANITTANVATLNVSGASTFTGASQMTSLTVQAITGIDASFSGDFVSTGSATFSGSCEIADLLVTTDTATDTLSVAQNATVGGDLTVDNDIVADRIEATTRIIGDAVNTNSLSVEYQGDPSMSAKIKYTPNGIASASQDCVAITEGVGVAVIAQGSPIPAKSLYIEFNY